ncbi:MAG: LapA family protein [Gallionella sp.]|nr:LapA family protein [Gallionella sp.]
MRIFSWLWRFITFIVLLGFAVKNNQPVTLRFFFEMEWHTSLVIVLLLFFTAGVAIGVLAMLFNLLQERKEITALKREIRVKNQLANIESKQDLPL